MITTTVYKGRLSTRPGARLVTLSDAEYRDLRRIAEAEALEKRETVRFGPDEIRKLMKSAGWTEVPPPKRRTSPWQWAGAGLAVGTAIVLVLRSCA